MIPLTLDEVAAATRGATRGDGSMVVSAVTTDSRDVPPDSLFVALRTDHGDGHDHVPAAVAAGAVAVLTEQEPEPGVPAVVVEDTWAGLRALAGAVRARVDPVTVAITGSVGKTTVKDLTHAAVAAARPVHAARGSFNNELGVPLTLLGLEADDEVLVAEVGARHVGDIATLADTVRPDISVVTAVAAVHLAIFGSIEAIARAKGELVDALGSGGLAVLNGEDPRVAAMAARAPRALRVGIDPGAADGTLDVWAEQVTLDRRALATAVAVTPWGRAEFRLPVSGHHQVRNGLFALAVAGHLGVDLASAAGAIADAPVSPWRGAVEEVEGIVLLDDAYNANPTAVVAALDTLLAIERTGRTIAVLGEMAELGPSAADEHRAVGIRCGAIGVERLVVVGSAAAPIAEGARDGGVVEVCEVPDAEAAGALLVDEVRAGDVVLVKASRVVGLERVCHQLRTALVRRPETDRNGSDRPVVDRPVADRADAHREERQ